METDTFADLSARLKQILLLQEGWQRQMDSGFKEMLVQCDLISAGLDRVEDGLKRRVPNLGRAPNRLPANHLSVNYLPRRLVRLVCPDGSEHYPQVYYSQRMQRPEWV
jgi:hypothetical protein